MSGLRRIFGGTTPGRLRGAMLGLTLLVLLAGAVSLWAAAGISDAARTVGRDAEPSVALALRMSAGLGDMDAAALADSLVGGGEATGTSAEFRQAMLTLSSDLVEAARNVTYGEAEAAPLRELQRWTLAYQEAVAEARTYGAGDRTATLRRVQWATRVNRDFATPEAGKLAEANASVLEDTYRRYQTQSLLLGGMAVGAFLLLVLALVAVQAWLARRMRRTLNPMLAGATLVAAAAGLWLGATVLQERITLRVAKDDAYGSLRPLFQAKVAVSALQADTSMWLLDPEPAARAAAQARMDASAWALVEVYLANPARLMDMQTKLMAAVRLEEDGQVAAARAATPQFGGFLGKELNNITFGAAERGPATDSILRLADAAAAVRRMQALEGRRQHTEAVAGWLGQGLGEGSTMFAALRAALDRTIAVNQAEFDQHVSAALGTAARLPWVVVAALALVLGLSLGGLWQRLREYR